ncbi:hypothetical protein T492DRAFT_892567 [Pavlovales sp. CCMP2436]|nr:hypothetical protein T492DRAFT_892567 [Pavlovales sp. CCMP2436]
MCAGELNFETSEMQQRPAVAGSAAVAASAWGGRVRAVLPAASARFGAPAVERAAAAARGGERLEPPRLPPLLLERGDIGLRLRLRERCSFGEKPRPGLRPPRLRLRPRRSGDGERRSGGERGRPGPRLRLRLKLRRCHRGGERPPRQPPPPSAHRGRSAPPTGQPRLRERERLRERPRCPPPGPPRPFPPKPPAAPPYTRRTPPLRSASTGPCPSRSRTAAVGAFRM